MADSLFVVQNGNGLTAEYLATYLHWIWIASIVIHCTCILYLVLQSTPTHVKEMVVEWQGILHATHIQISWFFHWKQKAHPSVRGLSKNLVCKQSLTKVSGDENKTKAFIMSIQEQARHDFLPVSHESSFHKIVYILLAVSQLGCRSGRYVLS